MIGNVTYDKTWVVSSIKKLDEYIILSYLLKVNLVNTFKQEVNVLSTDPVRDAKTWGKDSTTSATTGGREETNPAICTSPKLEDGKRAGKLYLSNND